MGKILMKTEPQNIPIVGYEKEGFGSRLKVVSNRNDDEKNGNLNDVKSRYEKNKDFTAIYIGIKGYDGNECVGLTIVDTEELIESLQSMVNIIKGN